MTLIVRGFYDKRMKLLPYRFCNMAERGRKEEREELRKKTTLARTRKFRRGSQAYLYKKNSATWRSGTFFYFVFKIFNYFVKMY